MVEATFEYIGTLISENGKEKDFHRLLVADAKSRGWVGLGLSVGMTQAWEKSICEWPLI